MTAPDLADRLAADLDGTFEALVLEFQRPVFRFAYRYCGNAQDAEEIAQDAFVRAYAALRDYEPERIAALHLSPWLLTITVNLARNRARGRLPDLVALDGAEAIAAAADERPEQIGERRELGDLLATALLELPPRYRSAVILRYVLGYGYDEMAQVLGRSPGTVKSQVHRGVLLLRDRLSAPGLMLAEDR